MVSSSRTLERRSLRLTAPAAAAIVATIVALVVLQRLFVAAHRPLSWAAAAVVAAVVLDPIVDRLATRIRRVPAVILTLLVLAAGTVGLTYLVFDEVEGAIDRLQEAAPEAAESIEARDDRVGELAQDFGLVARVDSFVAALEERITGGDDVLRSTAGTAPTYLVSGILTIFLMTYGPRIANGALAQDPDESRRQRVAEVVARAARRARNGVLLTVALAVTVAAAATLVAAALDLPAPSAVGATVGVLAVLPHVGIVVGSLPLLLFTVGFRSLTAALVLAVAVVGVQLLDSLVARPRIALHSLELGLFVPWAVALLGYTIYGIGGAAFGLAYAAFALALLDQVDPDDPAGPAPS
jgi:predicted PurR-regulated permease PerM